MIVSFCGHSRFHESGEIESQLLQILEEQVGGEPCDFYLGGYGSFDSFARKCCAEYQKTHPQTSLIFVTPYITIEYQKNHLDYEKDRYDSIVYPDIEDKPLKFAITYRNKWMVEKADLVIAYVDYSTGGAYQTYQHAKRKKKPIFNLGKLDR